MQAYVRAGVRWIVLRSAGGVLARVKGEFPNEQAYRDDREALQDYLCAYFSNMKCQTALGASISPIGGTRSGGKILKVRWNRPGQGKSGGLRLIVVANCDRCEVRIALAYLRADAPADEVVEDATKDL